MSNFDDLSMAVASFGGNNAVKFDDLGMPSIMVAIPKMKYSDIITGGTQETLPWWIVDGVEKEAIWVSKYINTVVNDRAYSLPMKDPKAYIDFDTALAVRIKRYSFLTSGMTGLVLFAKVMKKKDFPIPCF